MRCKRVKASAEQLLDPQSSLWRYVPGETLALGPTPLANQPSEYIKASREPHAYGRVRQLQVQACHNGTEIFFRLGWHDPRPNLRITDNNVFPDACGILMPLRGGDPPIEEMGNRKWPVNAWYWRADRGDEGRNVYAFGLGTTTDSPRSFIRCRAAWTGGGWRVVFARKLALPEQAEEAVQLAPGQTVKVGFAVWEGGNGERAGLKAFSKEWRPLELEG